MDHPLELRPSRRLFYLRLVASPAVGLIPAAFACVLLFYKISPWVVFPSVFVPIALAIVLSQVIHFPTMIYQIDSRYLVNSEGYFWKVRRSTPLDKITNVDVRQGPLARALGFGEIWIFTPSTGALVPEARLVGIQNPHEIRALILSHVNALKKQEDAGPAGEAVGSHSLEEIVSQLKGISSTLQRIEKGLKKDP